MRRNLAQESAAPGHSKIYRGGLRLHSLLLVSSIVPWSLTSALPSSCLLFSGLLFVSLCGTSPTFVPRSIERASGILMLTLRKAVPMDPATFFNLFDAFFN